MQKLLLIASAITIIAGLMAVVALLLYAFCWTLLLLLRFVPVIGRKHRHPRWDELTRRSGRA
jgi:hypothetical protein